MRKRPVFNMEIYLKHPVHGVKVATLETEADADVANGWQRCDVGSLAPVQVDKPVVRRSKSKTSEPVEPVESVEPVVADNPVIEQAVVTDDIPSFLTTEVP